VLLPALLSLINKSHEFQKVNNMRDMSGFVGLGGAPAQWERSKTKHQALDDVRLFRYSRQRCFLFRSC
jgi:hypothetical protein